MLDLVRKFIIVTSKLAIFICPLIFLSFPSFSCTLRQYISLKQFFPPIPVTETFGSLILSFRLGRDFHWYRLDSDGKWSHKPGRSRVIKYDNDAKDITDPRNANMGNYQFVCFMSTDSHGNAVTIT